MVLEVTRRLPPPQGGCPGNAGMMLVKLEGLALFSGPSSGPAQARAPLGAGSLAVRGRAVIPGALFRCASAAAAGTCVPP